MIKFVQRQVYQMQEFTDQNGNSYRTTSGLHWEERMDQSWEYVHRDEELTAAYNRFQSGGN
jgi:hypothetical protein